MQGRNRTNGRARRPVHNGKRSDASLEMETPKLAQALPSTDDWEGIMRIFTAAPLVPEQFYQASLGAQNDSGETALMRAVLEDAIHCFQRRALSRRPRDRRLANEAEEWFFTDDRDYLFSFVNICAVLGLEPEYIRRGLKFWIQQPRTTPPRKTRRPIPSRPQLLRAA